MNDNSPSSQTPQIVLGMITAVIGLILQFGVGMFFIRYRYRWVGLVSFGVILLTLIFGQVVAGHAHPLAQVPTGSIPTVTGTPVGALVIVLNSEAGFANVRSGPGTAGYEIVGVLVEGQQVPALGRSPGGDWVQIAYPGVPGGVAWIWVDLVEVRGTLPVIEPPPTPTPAVTPTIDPTLAAQFLVEIPPTKLPTYTAPAPISIPTFPADSPVTEAGRVPMGLVIIGLGVVGLFGMLISLLRGR
jgi:hypothetical protein